MAHVSDDSLQTINIKVTGGVSVSDRARRGGPACSSPPELPVLTRALVWPIISSRETTLHPTAARGNDARCTGYPRPGRAAPRAWPARSAIAAGRGGRPRPSAATPDARHSRALPKQRAGKPHCPVFSLRCATPVKTYAWNEEKNERLKTERGVSLRKRLCILPLAVCSMLSSIRIPRGMGGNVSSSSKCATMPGLSHP